MKIKRFILSAAAATALAAVTASSAMAGSTPGGVWYVNGTKLSGSEAVECAAAGTLTLDGSVAGIPVKLTATGVECVEATIFNNGGGTLGEDAGRLRFTGVSVDEPPNCVVDTGTVTTNNLSSSLAMDTSESAITFDRFETTATNLAVVPLRGKECVLAGNRPITGHVYAKASNLTGETSATQPFEFSPVIDATAGSELKLAGNAAHLTGTINTTLASGTEFEVGQ